MMPQLRPLPPQRERRVLVVVAPRARLQARKVGPRSRKPAIGFEPCNMGGGRDLYCGKSRSSSSAQGAGLVTTHHGSTDLVACLFMKRCFV